MDGLNITDWWAILCGAKTEAGMHYFAIDAEIVLAFYLRMKMIDWVNE